MGKNKLRKFAEMERFERVLQYPFGRLRQCGGFPLRGKWHSEFFGNDNPIVVELGCGRGEYTVGLARKFSDKNFIGIDIKGARMWAGAKEANECGLTNAAFLRTGIELLPEFFAPGEVSELWITFPDPQMKKVRKRLTGTAFLNIYRKVLASGGIVNLKTDSPFLYAYTSRMLAVNGIKPIADTADLYNTPGLLTDILEIRTHYEQQWLSRGLSIKYLAFPIGDSPLSEPDVSDIPPDDYRSYGRDAKIEKNSFEN